MEIVEFHPEPSQYAFTFGGVAPVRKVRPGSVLRLWTDDAFCGSLRSVADLPSAKLTMPFVNPQTGPFYVEGAEPGDTLQLLSQVGEAPLANVVDVNYSALAKVPKALVPGGDVYGGMHRHLRAIATGL
jgi:hypothetical protein